MTARVLGLEMRPLFPPIRGRALGLLTAEGFSLPANTPDMIRSIFSQRDSNYGPSLLNDMEEGRLTEGQHTLGDVVERANSRGVSVPLLTAALCNHKLMS